MAVLIEDRHHFTSLELTTHIDDTDRQQTLAAIAQGRYRTAVEPERAPQLQMIGTTPW